MSGDGSSFEGVVEGLRHREAYPHAAPEVTVLQTHVSVVFLAGDFVYKLKKPVHFGFVDMSTLAQRRHYCEEEVRLNQRLSLHLYLGVVAITESPAGIRVGGDGTALEYAVHMHRLPEARMMDRLLSTQALIPALVEQLAELIAEFHARAETSPAISALGGPGALRTLWDEHFAQTRGFVGRTLSSFQDALLQATVRAWLVRKEPLLRSRVEEGRVRDVHGDLRTSAVCFTEPIQVFDCLDFSQRYRCSDVASEVAFLSMDLRLHRRPDLSQAFVRRYLARTGDGSVASLLPFYGTYRACIRGKVEGLRAEEPEVPAWERGEAANAARRCFALACQYAREDPPPILVMICGLSGTGKSTLAATLADRLELVVVASDRIRKELHHLPATEHRPAAFGEGLYTEAVTRATYAGLLEQARRLLVTGRSVLLDATFQRRWQRELALELAAAQGALAFFIELRASDATVRARLAARAHEAAAVSDADWGVYLVQKAAWEPIDRPAWEHVVVSADGPPEASRAAAIEGLQARLEPLGPSADPAAAEDTAAPERKRAPK